MTENQRKIGEVSVPFQGRETSASGRRSFSSYYRNKYFVFKEENNFSIKKFKLLH